MMALPRVWPSRSTGTVPDHCPVQPTARMAAGGTSPRASSRRAALEIARHHSPGVLLGATARQQVELGVPKFGYFAVPGAQRYLGP